MKGPPASLSTAAGIHERGSLVRLSDVDGAPLVLVPAFDGLDAAMYLLADLLPDHCCYCYTYGSGPHLKKSVEEMASDCADLIVATVPRTAPLRIGGYSAGAFVALEAAHLLTSRDREVDRLLVFDQHLAGVAPPSHHDPALNGGIPSHVAAALDMLWSHSVKRGLTCSLEEYLAMPAEERTAVTVDAWKRSGVDAAVLRGWLTDFMSRVAANYLALRKYTPRPYPGAAAVICTSGDGSAPDRPSAWAPMLSNIVRMCRIPGDHEGLFDRARHPELAAAVNYACS